MEVLVGQLKTDVNQLNNHIAFGFKHSYEHAKKADQMDVDIDVVRD